MFGHDWRGKQIMKNKKVVLITILALVILGGISFSTLHYQKVEAERIAKEEREALIKEVLDKAQIAVDLAYSTRKEEDMELAKSAISKINDNKKKDKQKLSDKLTQLIEFLKQLDDTHKQLSKTEKSKSQTDIDATQNLIDNMTVDYLKKDKEEIQKKLNKIKADKAKSDKEKADKAKAEQLKNEQTQVINNYTPPTNSESDGYASPETGGNYTPPTNHGNSSNNNGSQNTPAPPPSQGNDISGTDAPNGHEMEPGGYGTQGTNDINGWEIDTEY